MDIADIPVLSLDSEGDALPARIGASFRTYGFAMVRDHGIPADLIAQGWQKSAAFFALPEAVKRRYLVDGIGGARGYTPFRAEIAKGATAHDLKEFWHVGRDLPPGSPLADRMRPNVWPCEIAGFEETFSALFAAFDKAGSRLLGAIAISLGLEHDWFEPAIRDGNSILRLLHYPPVTGNVEGAVRAGAHEDINLITLLLGAQEAGLELQDRDGRWLTVDPPDGAMVVNIGDMLQRLTNRVLPSTTHRVRNPQGPRARFSRYSMPFFLHLRSDFTIRTLAQCKSASRPDLFPDPITADDYLQIRLREIGLVK